MINFFAAPFITCVLHFNRLWKNSLPPESTTYIKTLLDLNAIFNNIYQRYPPTKNPTPANVPSNKVQSKDPTIVPRVKLHSNGSTIIPRVQPPAATPAPQLTFQQSKHIRNISNPIVFHNKILTIHLSGLEETFISFIIDTNAILYPTTGYLLELIQLLKTSEAKLWIYR